MEFLFINVHLPLKRLSLLKSVNFPLLVGLMQLSFLRRSADSFKRVPCRCLLNVNIIISETTGALNENIV